MRYQSSHLLWPDAVLRAVLHGLPRQRHDPECGAGVVRGSARRRPGTVSHEGSDVGVVRVVAAVGEVAKPGDGLGHALVVAEDGLVEADGELEDRGGDGDAGDADLLA